MSVDSNRFALLKGVTAYFFNLCWPYPLIYILVCSCGLIGLLFPKVFQCLVSFILLCISTYLFLSAFVSVRPPLSQSLKAEEEKPAESHEVEEHGDRRIENLYAANWQGETQIAACHENVETIKEAKPEQKFENISDISNEGRNLLKFKCEEDLESFEANGVQRGREMSSGNPSDVIVVEDKEENVSTPADEHKLPLGFGTEEEAAAKEEEEEEEEAKEEEDNVRKHGFVSSEGEEEEGDNDIRFENFLSGWKSQFECSSDSLSEASSLGELEHLLDELDPLLLTDEEEEDEADEPNASTKAHEDEDDRPMIWAAEDEGLFDLAHHHHGSDSESIFSEDDNLIEIEISKNQVLDDDKEDMHKQRNYLGDSCTEEPNLIDLDYSEDDKLQGQNFWEEGCFSANFPEEENLIEIDLSAHTVAVPLPAVEDKVSPIHICAEKKVPRMDLLIDELYNGWVHKITLPPVPPTTVVDLIDLNSPSILEMNMAGSEDEQPKPEKTESIHISITKKIQDRYIANLLD